MIKKVMLVSILVISAPSVADCWVVENLQGYGAMSGDSYSYGKDKSTSASFHITIDGEKASVFEANSGYLHDMKYIPITKTTMVGLYQAGGGVTVETWSITTDGKALYSKVMNIPGMQQVTSTKSFVGDVVGNCQK